MAASNATSKAASTNTSRTSSDNGINDFANAPSNGAAHRTQVPIAVVGMGCRLPGHSSSPTKLWELLQRGGIAVNEPPESRFSLGGHYDKTTRARTMKSPGGMFLEDVDPAVFDGQFFNINRVDCTAMDPQQRQMLEVMYECLENAGIPLEAISGTKTGVIVGTNFIDYAAIQNRDPEDRADSITIGLASSILSNRVSHFLNVNGPSMTIDTACSASLVSVDVACGYLDRFQADAVLVGGANMWMAPEHNEEVGMMHITQSASGKCHSFDAKGDGYVKAEGINAVYLKRLDDAIRDHDPIRAIIRGTAANASGRTAGIANPNPDMQAAVTRQAYKNAGITDFTATQFLECHGTGTLAGDPIEVRGAASVFSAGRAPGSELIIGSIKSNIGHSESAAGLSGLLKATMAVEQGIIPGNPTFITPNPRIDWEGSRVKATRTSLKWPRGAIVRRASVNSFGFGGANAHAVIEQAPVSRHVSSYQKVTSNFFDDEDEEDDDAAATANSKPPSLLVFSANDQGSLKNYAKSLSAHLLNPMVSVDIDDLAYTLSERRSKLYYRAFAITNSTKTPLKEESLVLGKQAATQPRIGFVFTGQGAQWSQMGAELINTFPQAKAVVQSLDKVLQTLPEPPTWTLLEELTAARSSEALRRPEFSQPLVTALQLALLEVLSGWGIHPQAVVGHSSGEIAAAAAAGLITHADAIVTAFYRGQAAKKCGTPPQPVGMLAVGVGAEKVAEYLRPEEGKVQIACFNSPSSLTMSGTVAALEGLRDRLQADGHFARLLFVDLAYHSDYMAEIGEVYEQMLLRDNLFQEKPQVSGARATMYSSVTGKQIGEAGTTDAAYWKSNMVSPVQFTQAAGELLKDTTMNTDFLIELGPSGALAGPISQIKKSLGSPASDAQYTAALARGSGSIFALYKVAGQLFLSGGKVDLTKVNGVDKNTQKMVIDLPNYSWNHSNSYWHESRASKEWRFKKFVNHDILGSKIPATAWRAPAFKKVLKVADVPWLRDHKLGSETVFPAAAYVSMAVEAMYQTAMTTQWSGTPPARYRYRLRDVKLLRALVLEESSETRLTLSLTPVKGGSTRTWYEFAVCSIQDGNDIDPVHSTGLVCIETDYQAPKASAEAMKPLDLPTPARTWYKALANIGYNFGPCFQKHLAVEASIGKRSTRSTVNLEPPPGSELGQSYYPVHPAVLDSIFQTGSPSLFNGDLPNSDHPVLVPKVIDSITIEASHDVPTEGIALSSATFLGVGSKDASRNYATNAALYDPKDGTLLFEMKGLSSAEIEAQDDEKAAHTFTRLAWQADVDLLMSGDSVAADAWLKNKSVQEILNLFAHKKPGSSVLEVNLSSEDGSSLWMQDLDEPQLIRAATAEYHLAVRDPKTLITTQEKLASSSPTPQMHLVDPAKVAAVAEDAKFDLAIVKQTAHSGIDSEVAIASLATAVHADGFVLAQGFDKTALARIGKVIALNDELAICQVKSTEATEKALPTITHVSLAGADSGFSADVTKIVNALSAKQWGIQSVATPQSQVTSSKDVVLIVDELFTSLMDTLSEAQWDVIKHLVSCRCPLLWVTTGGHLNVTNPTRAAIAGLFRTIRAEEQVPLYTLDVESPSSEATIAAVSSILQRIATSNAKSDVPVDSEFVERGGVVYVNRLLPADDLTAQQSDALSARPTELADLRKQEALVQLRCERLGNLDAVQFGETSAEVTPVPDGLVEVEVSAAGLNYKDVVVTMGIVPGDETQLGHEASGTISKVGAGVEGFAVGDRVVVFGKGCFANRLRTVPARVHKIPDNISFEEAATLAVVYLTSMHSLFDLGNLTAGKRVLIHSAAGGVGIAAIQLAQYVGAEVFATVGSPNKREYLKTTFGLTDDHLFNSRNTDFGAQILAATDGRGVDVVLNSLTGDMLDESFRVLADGGIMVEIGKKDIIDRNGLTMTPFDRNISFRAVDLSPERAPDALVARHMSKLFELIRDGHVKPISPIHKFSWADIPSAIRFLRPGSHIGKVVLSDGVDGQTVVPIRRAPPTLKFREDGAYLIVGGLRGLCGSLAIYLAKTGAKHLAVMARSGYNDDKSRQVIKQVKALGAEIDLLVCDVTKADDVEKAFKSTAVPIAGIIQGAMVLRDRPFDHMTHEEYHLAVQCKLQGTWNLHNAAESQGLKLDFFTMLSSISGVIGNRGQANYAAANVFLDSFAEWRRAQGQAACSVNLGVIEDAGVIAENEDLNERFDSRMFKSINDGLLKKILYLSILQQSAPDAAAAVSGQMITGIMAPQPADSHLKADARFSALFTTQADGSGAGPARGGNAEVQAVLLLLKSKTADPAALLQATVEAVNSCFMKMMHLAEPMDPARPLSVYGIDSLAAVEVRNWVRNELGALVTTLDILNAASLTAFCEKIIVKAQAE